MIEVSRDNQQLSSKQTYEVLQFYLETVVSEYTAFNHSQFVYPLYQTFQFELNQYLHQISQSDEVYEQIKELQKKATEDSIIIDMLNEYEEFINPISIQVLPLIGNKKQPQKQIQKKAVSCILDVYPKNHDFNLTGSQSLLFNKDNDNSIEEIDNTKKLLVIKEFDEKSYVSQINFQRDPLQDLTDVIKQRMEQSKNYYFNEAQLDDAYYVIQQAQTEIQENEVITKWYNENYGEYVKMINDKMATMQMNLNELESDGWIVEKQSKSLTVKYKIDSKNSTVTLFMDSVFDANITKLMALINEIDLYQNYVPFCVRSSMPKKLGKCSRICDIQVYFPLISDRKAVFVGEGIDRLNINGTIVFICKSIDNDPEFLKLHNIDLSKDKGKFVNLILNYYVFELTPISETKCRVRAVTNSDPQCRYIPKALVALVARKMASTLFEKMQKITTNFERSPWYPKFVENKEFYDWIDNKVQIHLQKN